MTTEEIMEITDSDECRMFSLGYCYGKLGDRLQNEDVPREELEKLTEEAITQYISSYENIYTCWILPSRIKRKASKILALARKFPFRFTDEE